MSILFARSHFSVGESMLAPDEIPAIAAKLGYTHAALTDTMTISGIVDFTNACKKANIKPIVGARVRVVRDPTYRDPPKKSGLKPLPNPEWFVDLYILRDQGFEDLCALLSKANSPEYFYYVPRVGLEDMLLALRGKALCAITSDTHSVFHIAEYRDVLYRMANEGPCMARIVPGLTPLHDTLNRMAFNCGLPLLASYTALYTEEQGADTKDVYNAVCSNTKMDAPWRRVPHLRDFTPVSPANLHGQLQSALGRISATWLSMGLGHEDLEKQVEYTWKKMAPSLPKIAANEYAELVKLCREGWDRRFKNPVLGYLPPKDQIPVYMERLRYELSVLKKMGFEGYFLLVDDLVNWAKRNGIKVGPGRGSVGGSLVAYLIGITDVDPIRFGLLFERFINPERIDLPDADLDFMSARRHEVIQYLTEKYRPENVAGISNYGTMGAASAVRDVGRVFGLDDFELSATKLMPKEHGQSVSLEESAKLVPQIEAFKNKHPQIWGHALKLEGKIRSMGRHAAGVIVAGEPIIKRGVVESRGGEPTVNWDKVYAEDMGLVKLDVLGLSTLDVLDSACKRVKEMTGQEIDLLSLPIDDEKSLEAFGRGDTTGVFQFESPGMRKLLKSLAMGGKLKFDDLVVATALYRPGPMDAGLMDDFVAIRQGARYPDYEHPKMEPALKETLSVIVYQEQVMRLAVDLAGFTGAQSDHLRKAMGKKDPVKMAEWRDKWVAGCETNAGMAKDAASRLFDKIELFAGYAFNKSHSVEYSIISFWCMWFKQHHPEAWFAAALDFAKSDDALGIVSDAAKHNVALVPPDVNLSTERFEISYDPLRGQKIIVAPFRAVKGISENGSKAIIEGRLKAGGRFNDLKHFEDSVNKRLINIRVRDHLDKVGAFASIVPGQLQARHPDRLRDQLELLPGLILDAVKADRKIVVDKFIGAKLVHNVQDYKACKNCSLAGRVHPMPALGKSPKFMVITDCPTWSEDAGGQIMAGKTSDFVRAALKEAGFTMADGYFTTLVKSMKDGDKLSNESINACSGFLKRELEILKPPVIIALGNNVRRYLLPQLDGGMETVGRRVYDKNLDATIIVGFNPAQIAFDSAKQELLNLVFKSAFELVV